MFYFIAFNLGIAPLILNFRVRAGFTVRVKVMVGITFRVRVWICLSV